MNSKIIAIIAGVVLVGGGSFYAGMKYDQSVAAANRASAQARFQQGGNGVNGQRGGMRGANGGGASGDVIAQDDKSITVQLRDGGSKIVFISGTTQVMKAVEGTTKDIAVGDQVTALGTTNADGSISAQMIQIRPKTAPQPQQQPQQ